MREKKGESNDPKTEIYRQQFIDALEEAYKKMSPEGRARLSERLRYLQSISDTLEEDR